MEVLIKFLDQEEYLDAPQTLTSEFSEKLGEVFDIDEFILIDEEEGIEVKEGDDMISRVYSLDLTRKQKAIKELEFCGIPINPNSLRDNDDFHIISLLVDAGIDIDSELTYPHSGIEYDEYGGYYSHEYNSTKLDYIFNEKNKIDMIEFLCEKGADPSRIIERCSRLTDKYLLNLLKRYI